MKGKRVLFEFGERRLLFYSGTAFSKTVTSNAVEEDMPNEFNATLDPVPGHLLS